jgi:hypothetical protein
MALWTSTASGITTPGDVGIGGNLATTGAVSGAAVTIDAAAAIQKFINSMRWPTADAGASSRTAAKSIFSS